MTLIKTTLTGLAGVLALATFFSIQGLTGQITVTWGTFAAWMSLLTVANAMLGVACVKSWKGLSLRGQALAILWVSVATWYWTVAPLFYFLSINVDQYQLAWAAFAFIWEVPVIGGGLFVLLALLALKPVYDFMDRGKQVKDPARLYRLTYWYPITVGTLLFLVSVFGYTVGAAQLKFFADFPLVEQVKNLINGAVVSLFLSVFFYLIFDSYLIRVRERLAREYVITKKFWRAMNSRVIGITTILMIGSIGLLGLIAFDAVQLLVSRSEGNISLDMLRDQEVVAAFSGAVLLVLGLTVGIIVFVGQALTRTLRQLAQAVTRVQESHMVVPVLVTGDEIEALSQTLAQKLQDLAMERTRLTEAKVHTDAILNSMGEGLVVTDSAGRVIRVNSQTEQLIGAESKDLIGQYWSRAVNTGGKDKRPLANDEGALYLALHTGRQIHKTSYTYTKSDGTVFPVSVTATPLLVEGEVVGAVLLFRDITREKAVEQAKTEFVSLASHQLRTPITAINWYIELLLRGELSEAQKSDLRKIRLRGQRMVQLVNDLLNVSRLDTGRLKVNPQPADLVELVSGVVEEVMPLAMQRACQLIFHKTDESLPGVTIDRSLLRQVLHNLIVNAVTYSPPGQNGRVWVQLEKTAEGKYLISVQDYGMGIPHAERTRVFDKFFRADNAIRQETEGTGLGLYIAKKILTSSGGKIWFESLEGRGTTFFVEIPAEGMRERAGVDLAV